MILDCINIDISTLNMVSICNQVVDRTTSGTKNSTYKILEIPSMYRIQDHSLTIQTKDSSDLSLYVLTSIRVIVRVGWKHRCMSLNGSHEFSKRIWAYA